MVDQLWLWLIKGQGDEPDTVITSFPSRDGADSTAAADDPETLILDEEDRDPIVNTTDLLSRIMTVCCRAMDRYQEVESLKFLQFFESAIGNAVSSIVIINILTPEYFADDGQEDKETLLFTKFRAQTKLLYGLHDKHAKYQEQRSKLLKKLLDIRSESNLLKEVKDILDEIKMILSVLCDQIEILESDGLKEFFKKPAEVSASPSQTPPAQITVPTTISHPFPKVRDLINGTKKNFTAMEAHAKDVEKGVILTIHAPP